jgi:hypothetical protein
MPITNEKMWNEWVVNNTDPYGKACVDVARKAMELLDADPGPIKTDDLIRRADDAVSTGGITGFMAACVAQMISQCHSRGEEFRRQWNEDNQLGNEGDRANQSGGILNPAILEIR